jgi:hypothetical protein
MHDNPTTVVVAATMVGDLRDAVVRHSDFGISPCGISLPPQNGVSDKNFSEVRRSGR